MENIHRNEKGVSLIELLVGIVVFALLVLMVDSVFISAHRTARTAELGANTQQNARIAVERLTREIRESSQADGGVIVDSSGTWVAFQSARLGSDPSVFCLNVTDPANALYNVGCGATGSNFMPVWQSWIVYWFDGSGVLRRDVQPITWDPMSGPVSGSGDVIAGSVQSFDAKCPNGDPYLEIGPEGRTFCVRLVAEGREVVQGSGVPPQQVILESKTLIRN